MQVGCRLFVVMVLAVAVTTGPHAAFAQSAAETQQGSSANTGTQEAGTGSAQTSDVAKLLAELDAGTPGPDLNASIEELGRIAEAGDSRAAYRLAEYFSRRLNPPDNDKAIHYYELAAAANHDRSMVRLADIYASGGQSGKGAVDAIALYERAADLGNLTAAARLGNLYAEGKDAPRDVAKATEYLERAVAGGNSNSALSLGDLYRDGKSDGLDPSKSIEYYTIAADGGNAGAALRLGDIYRDGTLVPADPAKALTWYRQASDAGNASAFLRIAMGHIDGTIAGADPKQGVAMLEESVTRKLPTAARRLADILLEGRLVPLDVNRAIILLEGSTTDAVAQRRLISLYADGQMPGPGRSPGKAIAALTALHELLPSDQTTTDDAVVAAANSRSATDYAAAADKALLIDDKSKRRAALVRIVSISPNTFIAVLQKSLINRGLYTGQVTGALTAPTIRAINELCKAENLVELCRNGPLAPAAARALASFT